MPTPATAATTTRTVTAPPVPDPVVLTVATANSRSATVPIAPASRTSPPPPPALAYWNVNIPEDERTDECPEFLRRLTAKDRGIISTPESEYRTLSWPEVQALVRTGEIAQFRRSPLALRRYLAFLAQLGKRYGSAEAFLLRERLGWGGGGGEDVVDRQEGTVPRCRPFECENDVTVLQNDWPYGIDPRIVHLVVWTKFRLPTADNDETPAPPETIAMIDAYVEGKFRSRMPAGGVIWFKNWGWLKSVGGIEHFHVMLFEPDPEFVQEMTKGVVPLYMMHSR